MADVYEIRFNVIDGKGVRDLLGFEDNRSVSGHVNVTFVRNGEAITTVGATIDLELQNLSIPFGPRGRAPALAKRSVLARRVHMTAVLQQLGPDQPADRIAKVDAIGVR